METAEHAHPPSAADSIRSPADATQLRRFGRLRREFAGRYRSLRHEESDRFIRTDWHRRNRELERGLLPQPPWRFLAHPVIRLQMLVGERFLEAELDWVLGALEGTEARRWLEEDPAGEPPMAPVPDGSYPTSPNLVHHVHHLLRFRGATGVEAEKLSSVVEWGGGYGSLARLVWRLREGPLTYVIVDTPLFTVLQWLYLSTVFGREQTRLVSSPEERIGRGRLNLVPVGLVPELELSGDLFVSTWALNESAETAQRMVADGGWLGARHLLLGMHDGESLLGRAARGGARIEPVADFMAGQRYAFR